MRLLLLAATLVLNARAGEIDPDEDEDVDIPVLTNGSLSPVPEPERPACDPEVEDCSGGVVGGVVEGAVEVRTITTELVVDDAPMSTPPLKVLQQINPRYPKEAKKLGLGDVSCLVRFVVNERGMTTLARLEEQDWARCPEPFHAPSLEVAKLWTFAPPKVNGKGVRVTFVMAVRFKAG